MKDFKQRMKYKNNFLFYIFILITSCVNEVDNRRIDNKLSLKDDFNIVFDKIIFGDSTKYSFDDVMPYVPNLYSNFYSEDIDEKYYFFELTNNIGHIRIAVKTDGSKYYHEIYFLEETEGYSFIDESEYIICNLSFLNNHGFKIYSDSISSTSGWMSNIYDKRIIGNWAFDKTLIEKDTNLIDKFEVLSDSIIILNNDSLVYSKEENNIIIKNEVIFKIFAIGENKLLIQDGDNMIFFKAW
jgi:hypothetical protein